MNASLARRLSQMMLMLVANLPASAQADAKPAVSVDHADSRFNVLASIVLPLAPCNAYRLLTDYQELPRYIPGLLQLREKRLSPTRVEVWQEGVVQVLFFRVRLVSSLEMEETPERRVVFNQVSGDLQSYSGEWNLMKARDGTTVSYEATITLKPVQFAPAFLVKSVLEKEVTERFEALAGEALKRANKAMPECVSDK